MPDSFRVFINFPPWPLFLSPPAIPGVSLQNHCNRKMLIQPETLERLPDVLEKTQNRFGWKSRDPCIASNRSPFRSLRLENQSNTLFASAPPTTRVFTEVTLRKGSLKKVLWIFYHSRVSTFYLPPRIKFSEQQCGRGHLWKTPFNTKIAF